MNKLKQLIATWLNIEPVIQIETQIKTRTIIKDAPLWSNEHAKSLNAYLSSGIGKDLVGNMDSCEVTANAWAISSLNNSQERREFRAGVAHGIALAHNRFKRMSDVQKESQSDEASMEELEKILLDRIGGNL